MKQFTTITRFALLSGSCWYAYWTYHEYHHRKICEVEAARIKQALDSTVSKTGDEVEIKLVNSQSTLSSWLCYLPSRKAASVVLRTDGVFGRVLLRIAPSSLHQTAMIQLQFYEARDEVEEDRLTIWGPDFREVGIPLGEGFRILRYAHLLDNSEGGYWGGASGMPGNNNDGTPWIFEVHVPDNVTIPGFRIDLMVPRTFHRVLTSWRSGLSYFDIRLKRVRRTQQPTKMSQSC